MAAAKRRAVLAALALEAGTVVPVHRLLAFVWGEEPPASAKAALQGHVSALRRVLGESRVETRDPGYLLDVDPAEVDVHRFTAALDGGPDALRAALDLWRGPALADLPDTAPAREQAATLDAQRQRALVLLAGRLLDLGRGAEIAAELGAELAANPLHEPAARTLMLAQYQQGQQAEALATFHRTREGLAEELGIDPGEELRQAYHLVLSGDPDQRAASTPAPAPAPAPAHAPVPDPVGAPAPPRLPVVTVVPAAVRIPAPAQLPRPTPAFTGRTEELAWLDAHAGDGANRLVVVAGAPGMGKTGLAVQWAHSAAPRFPDGQLFANLGGFDEDGGVEPGEALHGFLRALGIPGDTVPEELDQRAAMLRSALAGRRMLLVLDNVADDASVRPLLPASSGCAVVVTSRNRLDGLVAVDGAELLTLRPLPLEVATGLIGEGPEAERMARLCDRLPLALRVAAARIAADGGRVSDELLRQLGTERERLRLLSTGDPEASVRAALCASVSRLSPAARELFVRLGAHPGATISTDVAAALAPGGTGGPGAPEGAGDPRGAAEELVRAHLHIADGDRHLRHDLIRLYAAELWQEHADPAPARLLLDHYLDRAAHASRAVLPSLPGVHEAGECEGERGAGERCARPIRGGADGALDWFAAEEPVIRRLLRSARDTEPERAWKLAANCSPLYRMRGSPVYGARAARTGLRAARRIGDRQGEAEMLTHLGAMLAAHGRLDDAEAVLAEAVALAREAATPQTRALCLDQFASCAAVRGRWRTALAYHREAIAVAGEHGMPRQEALAHANLGAALLGAGLPEEALAETSACQALLLRHPDTAVLGVAECVRETAYEALGGPSAACATVPAVESA